MVRTALQRAVIGVVVLGVGGTGAARSAQADAPVVRTVVLRPTKGPELRINFDYNFRNALPPFENEPALNGKITARGSIPTVPPTLLLRNITDNELYLKVDHGRDFSEGSLVTYRSRYVGHVLFEGLQVFTARGELTIPYTVRLYTYETGCSGWLMVESGWAGDFELDGRTWTLGVVDNLDGRIDGNDLFHFRDHTNADKALRPAVCPVPETLFFCGHTLRLDWAFESLDAQVVVKATLTELHPPMGNLRIEAQGSRHLRLCSDRLTALLDDPTGTISLPVGDYRVENCILYDKRNGRPGPPFVAYDRGVPITVGQTTSLRLGSPLSNTVEVSRDGNLVSLKHRLVGAGGERYDDFAPSNRPFFTVYQGPLRIAGGAFPFG